MSSSSHHYHTASEPHSYNIQAKLRNGILSIYVEDAMSSSQWRQEFTQISFPGHKLYDVAKSLIMAIKQMINNNDPSSNKAIAILVYNQWCYLTIYNCNIPSFALRPIQITNTNTNVSAISTNPKEKQKQSQDVNKSPKPSKPSNSHKHQFPTRPLPALPIAHRMATNISSPSCSNSDSFDSSDSSIIDSIFSNDGHRKKKRKSKQNANSGKPFKICLNGIVIDDMISHVFEQQLAEEEYYDDEEEEDDDEEYINATYYDPNYLAISPYYDDY